MLIFAMVSGLCLGCGSRKNGEASENGTSDKLVVRIGTIEMPNDEGIAKALGYFEEEIEAEVELIKFDSGRDVNTALASGSIDFGLEGSSPATLAIAQDLGVELIWVHEVLGSVESLVARKESGITSIEQLKGKKIATPFASTAHFSLLKALELAGISSSEVELLDMQTDKIYAAWVNGEIDATYVWQPTLANLEDAVVLKTSEDMAYEGYMTSNVEVVRKEFASAHPDIVNAYIRALDRATKLYEEDEVTAVKTIADALKLSEEDAKFQMSGSKWLKASEQISKEFLGTSASKGDIVQNLYDTAVFLKEQNSLKELPDIQVFEAAVNPFYAEEAAKE